MLQCQDCEYFSHDEKTGRVMLRCNPFSTIKEPACLEKLQLLRLDALLRSYQAIANWYKKLEPMQKRMFEFMKREMDDIDEADSWKTQYFPDDEEKDEQDPSPE